MEWLEGLWECPQHLRERYIYSPGMPSEPDTHGVGAVRRELPVVVGLRRGAGNVKGLLDHEGQVVFVAEFNFLARILALMTYQQPT